MCRHGAVARQAPRRAAAAQRAEAREDREAAAPVAFMEDVGPRLRQNQPNVPVYVYRETQGRQRSGGGSGGGGRAHIIALGSGEKAMGVHVSARELAHTPDELMEGSRSETSHINPKPPCHNNLGRARDSYF